MSFIPAIDVSEYQGVIDWRSVDRPIVIVKMSGGDNGLYTDRFATQNYYGAKNAGKAIGGYHFAGGGDPVNEADFFVACMSPLEEGDVLALDWEIEHPDPNGWCWAFVDRVHDRTGIWPLFYTNGDRINQHGFDAVREKCGTWVAWYGQDPEGNLPINGNYVMHQYTSSGAVSGIAGRVDLDAWFGTLEQWKKYGWHAAAPAPTPDPVPTPEPIPTPEPQPLPPPEPVPDPPAPDPIPEPIPEPTPEPVPDPPAPDPIPEPIPEPTPEPEPTPKPPKPAPDGWLVALIKLILRKFHLIK